MSLITGTVYQRGNSDVVDVFNNAFYREQNAGALYVPEGRFLSTDTDGNVVLADGSRNIIGISGISPYVSCIQTDLGQTQSVNRPQSMVIASIEVCVEFDATGGNIGDNVYLGADGKASLSENGNIIGILKSEITEDAVNSRGGSVDQAGLIHFNTSIPLAGATPASTNQSKTSGGSQNA